MATVVSSSNDTKKIVANMKQFDGLIADANTSIKAIQKAQQSMSKSPEKCKDAYKQLAGVVGGLADVAKDMDKLAKDTGKSIID